MKPFPYIEERTYTLLSPQKVRAQGGRRKTRGAVLWLVGVGFAVPGVFCLFAEIFSDWDRGPVLGTITSVLSVMAFVMYGISTVYSILAAIETRTSFH